MDKAEELRETVRFCRPLFLENLIAWKRSRRLRSESCLLCENGSVDRGDTKGFWKTASSLKSSGDAKRLRELVDGLRKTPVTDAAPDYTDLKLHMMVLQAFFSRDNVQGAMDHFEDMKVYGARPDLVIYNFLMSNLARRRRLRGLFKLRTEMESYGIPMDACSYSALIHGYAVVGNIQMAWFFYDEMRSRLIVPNESVFGNLASAASKNGDVRKVEQAIRNMLSYRIRPNQYVYNALISASAKSADIHTAIATFVRMQKEKIRPDTVTFTTLMAAYAAVNDLEGVITTYNEFVLRDLEPDVFIMCELIKAHARLGNVVDAERCFRDMKKSGLNPDRIVYSVMIQAYGRRGSAGKARETFEEMCDAGIKPNSVVFNELMDAYNKARDHDAAIRAFSLMQAFHVRPNSWAYTTLIHAYARKGDLKGAENALEDMLKRKFRPFTATFTTLIDGFANAGNLRKAIHYYSRIKCDPSMTLDSRVFNSIMRAYFHAGYFNRVGRQYRDMLRRGVTPDAHTYSMLIEANSAMGKGEMIEFLLKDMKERGVQSDEVVESSVLRGYFNNFGAAAAEKYLQSLVTVLDKHLLTMIALLVDRGQSQLAVEYCRRTKSMGVTNTSSRLLALWVQALLQTDDREGCVSIVHEFAEAGVFVDCESVKRIIESNLFTAEESRELFKGLGYSVVLGSMLSAYARLGKFDEVEALEVDRERLGIPRSGEGNLAFLSLQAMNGERSLQSAITELQYQRVLVERNLLSSVLQILAEAGCAAAALVVFEEISRRGWIPTLTCYNSAMAAYARLKRPTDILRLMNTMRRNHFAPDTTSYNRLMEAYLAQLKLAEAVRLFQDMRKEEVVPNIATFHILMRSHAKLEDSSMFIALYIELLRQGLKPNGITASMLSQAVSYHTSVTQMSEDLPIPLSVLHCYSRLNDNEDVDLPKLYNQAVAAIASAEAGPMV
uniref:Pentacotripeptide-repeat region of PRORP domain-containing protein n=1 Tax=Rhodosorus marinus TaxID=101924 RepID=A0A7S3EMD3_9RHOD|mmetsp:Transcript_44021/g.171838  ORF Transcript_44021/g.171838 Transcript_44021/m.171838 type:complete len:949 (+) Transcript_44021:323-3169(+)|eukprot:CAMPEP_0113966170 /NCGR_PEP_ID=MMETSP0011_2-20120614/8180_1 /TAXON_ID=101924 /ORGANISM="Rhodosorus marinus" /LENGTH=948 /DNA_ID=CAMNT_0000978821 /DNA_START=195 /DNA_END=3041 /DNA_ORIENTATION=- /assembly_acc=CAM_ASM_000156